MILNTLKDLAHFPLVVLGWAWSLLEEEFLTRPFQRARAPREWVGLLLLYYSYELLSRGSPLELHVRSLARRVLSRRMRYRC